MRRLPTLAAATLTLAACATTPGGPGAPITDVDWRLAEVDGRPALATPNAVRLRLQADSGRATGDAGCNRFAGPFRRDGDALRLGPLISTRRACLDAEATRQETAVLAALEGTRRYALAGDTLVLSGDGGSALARWVRAAP